MRKFCFWGCIWALRHSKTSVFIVEYPHARVSSPSTDLQASLIARLSFDLPFASLYIFVNAPSMKTSKAESDPLLLGAMLSGRSELASPNGQETFQGAMQDARSHDDCSRRCRLALLATPCSQRGISIHI